MEEQKYYIEAKEMEKMHTYDNLIELANSYGVLNPDYRNQKPDFKFKTMKESVKITQLHRNYSFDDIKQMIVNTLTITWNPNDNERFLNISDEELLKYIKKGVSDYKLVQCLENVRLSYRIDGVPRYMTAQLCRHRRATISELNHGSIDLRKNDCRLPDNIIENGKESVDEYKMAVINSYNTYADLIDAGVIPSQARSVIPMGVLTSMTMSMDLNAWLDFWRWRAESKILQPEQHYIANMLRETFKNNDKFLYDLIEGLRKGW